MSKVQLCSRGGLHCHLLGLDGDNWRKETTTLKKGCICECLLLLLCKVTEGRQPGKPQRLDCRQDTTILLCKLGPFGIWATLSSDFLVPTEEVVHAPTSSASAKVIAFATADTAKTRPRARLRLSCPNLPGQY